MPMQGAALFKSDVLTVEFFRGRNAKCGSIRLKKI